MELTSKQLRKHKFSTVVNLYEIAASNLLQKVTTCDIDGITWNVREIPPQEDGEITVLLVIDGARIESNRTTKEILAAMRKLKTCRVVKERNSDPPMYDVYFDVEDDFVKGLTQAGKRKYLRFQHLMYHLHEFEYEPSIEETNAVAKQELQNSANYASYLL